MVWVSLNNRPYKFKFLNSPAGGSFTVEIATNRAKTTLSYNGQYTSDWVDGATYPSDYNKSPGCITTPNMHTQNQSMAAGTAFAISYQSDIKQVTPDNLVVFSVRYHTPWLRLTTYDVPQNLPACPPGGCICAWGWVPNGCGEPNMYHQGFKCQVTGATSVTPLAAPKPPVWCEDNPANCVQGAKQMIYWNQQTGNNIQVDGFDLHGQNKSPAYNSKLGFADGAQNDIFAGPPSNGQPANAAAPPPPPPTSTAAPPPPPPTSTAAPPPPPPTTTAAPPPPTTTAAPPATSSADIEVVCVTRTRAKRNPKATHVSRMHRRRAELNF
ncbi:hypothetical protein DXG03_006538 [Asterophora parasitica]|uniref:Uncharacterized protein n=1 Tax=Asterophora parasitica TaxID=117018 RepID=A0A9P7G1A0_9AGAR|nr:hypothetical protein DXG03_006538 [Asterophora parasitica]